VIVEAVFARDDECIAVRPDFADSAASRAVDGKPAGIAGAHMSAMTADAAEASSGSADMAATTAAATAGAADAKPAAEAAAATTVARARLPDHGRGEQKTARKDRHRAKISSHDKFSLLHTRFSACVPLRPPISMKC
jgi:hypothetical protein